MRLPNILIPILVVAFALLAMPLKEAFDYPAAQMSFRGTDETGSAPIHEIVMTVAGVKCKGTAQFFISRYNGVDGILDMTAYAADHEVIVKYDASKIDIERIKFIAEAPVEGRDGNHYDIFVVEKVDER